MQAFSEYLTALRKNLAQGDATEHTHRSALQNLVQTVAKVTVINEAKQIKCGAPDFSLRAGTTPLAHIETKDIGTNLDEVEKGRGAHGDQFKRYIKGLPNWLLTDYLRFDWFVAGQFRKTVVFATREPSGKLTPFPSGAEALEHLLKSLVETDIYTVETAKDLARLMAGITHNLRDAIDQSFKSGSHSVVAWLSQWLTSFRETLIPELKPEEFADMFAQTLAYGLFAARIQTSKSGARFSHAEALLAVPKSNPFLRKIFSEMAGADMPEEFRWAVDDLVRLLEMADIAAILKNFGKESGQNDPIVHFYETFLAAYDPKLREKRGVYYTPEPVVRYIVRSVDSLLKTHFNKPKGLADEKTLILDPATGTATFLYEVIAHIRESMKGQEGAWPGYVRDHLLKRIFGFELLMAPYAVAHLKLGLELEQTGYTFTEGERLGIYLTNTLEESAKKSERLIAQAISDEAEAAADIKREKPILVVLGNPPYSGHSANRSRDSDGNFTFIGGLMEDYKRGIPELAKPAQAKWLQDDYVKFIRFAQWRIDTTGSGIVAFITNHGYLDNPTFRGMRSSLMKSFSEISVYDLHGNSKKKERSLSGEKDENVFDIQQGVAIILAVRRPDHASAKEVKYAEMWGTRAQKYAALNSATVANTKWQKITPRSPQYLFQPDDTTLREEYEAGVELPEVFSRNGSPAPGIVSTQDDFAIAFSANEVVGNVETLIGTNSEADARLLFRLCSTTQWNYARAKTELAGSDWRSRVFPILYRPFDLRWTVYDPNVAVHRRDRVMKHMKAPHNVGMITTKLTKDDWDCSVTDVLMGHKALAAYDINYVFPLYLVDDDTGEDNQHLFRGRSANLGTAFLQRLSKVVGQALDLESGLPIGLSPEDIFHYIYAIFRAPTYRTRYSDFLKRDFPRVPLTSSLSLFRDLAEKGRQLVALHLLKVEDAPQLDNFITTFPVTGSNEVTKVRYDPEKLRVTINDDQYFSGLPAATWNFQTGGYQALEKWLKDRKGRVLNFDDIQHWQRTAVALSETQRIMLEIDALIPSWPLQ